ncbi:hypothetical protein Tco_0505143, partial [Tanacetum coccineum]
DKPTKKTGKKRKQIARKGFHTHLDKDKFEDSDEANEKVDSTLGTKIPINPVPVATKLPGIANYKIIKEGKLYRIVMRKHGMNEPEDEFEKIHLEYLKNMFEEPLNVYMLIERKYPLSAEVCKAMLDKKLQGGKPDEDCYKRLKMMEKQAVNVAVNCCWKSFEEKFCIRSKRDELKNSSSKNNLKKFLFTTSIKKLKLKTLEENLKFTVKIKFRGDCMEIY